MVSDPLLFATCAEGLGPPFSNLLLSNDPRNGGARRHANVSTNPRLKHASGSSLPQNCRYSFPDFPVDAPHLLNAWLLPAAHKSVTQLAEHSPNRPAMNIGVRPIQVTQGFREPVIHRFHHKPRMLRFVPSLPRNRQSQLKRHIETWRPGVLRSS